VAGKGWGTDRPVADLLYEEGWRFEFHQAVKLLEILHPEGAPPGEGAEPEKEAVRFTSRVRMDFPASEVDSIAPPEEAGRPARMAVNFLGLAGAHGPLPAAWTERLLERLWHKDGALRDFLDIFNHRLVSLLRRAKTVVRPGYEWKPPDRASSARVGFALVGLGTPGVRDRMAVRDRAVLAYAGLLAQKPTSMVALQVVLADYFEVGVRGRQLRGRWLVLEEDQRTAIGRSGRHQKLGQGAALGARVWDQEAGIELALGPLDLARFLDFLPIGRAFRALAEIARFHAGERVEIDLQLTLQAAEVPPLKLGCGPRLGWTSWLKTKDFAADDSQVRLRVRR
jgi:type VI secretion system protein ImpH